MPWFNIRKDKKSGEQPDEKQNQPGTSPSTGSAAGSGRILPPHMQRIAEERSRERPRREASVEERRAAYDRKRLAILYDIQQGELAADPENPWKHRIELLTEALATVDDDLRATLNPGKSPFHPLPETPISGIEVDRGDAVRVAFRIGEEPFEFGEVLDWAERGHQIARPELRPLRNNVSPLIPDDTPDDLREPLKAHLADSVFTFATDLRDRALDEDSSPENVTLADLARPCPDCGGWTNWGGRCPVCTARKAEQQSLKRERTRLLSERASEAEERHRLAERLPIALRRLAELDKEIAAFERSIQER